MEIVVALLVIALIAAVVFAVLKRRSPGAPGLRRPGPSPISRRGRGVPANDPMAAAVVEQVRATDPQDIVVSEQRLQAQARQVASGLLAEANQREHQRASDQVGGAGPYAGDPRMAGADARGDVYPAPGTADGDPPVDGSVDPATGARTGGAGDPTIDPRYDDPNDDGPPAADPGDPRPRRRRRLI